MTVSTVMSEKNNIGALKKYVLNKFLVTAYFLILDSSVGLFSIAPHIVKAIFVALNGLLN